MPSLERDSNRIVIAGASSRLGAELKSLLEEGRFAAGERIIQLAKPEADPSLPGTWWIWGAADNIRLPATNAVKLAEMLA
jgi:hypothetical protein